jgi:hypothetical protein
MVLPGEKKGNAAMTKEQKMMAWHYAKVRKEAVDVLSEILGDEVADTKAGVCNALALVMHRKGSKDVSRAMLAASSWIWGHHEENAHEAESIDSAEPAKPVAVK